MCGGGRFVYGGQQDEGKASSGVSPWNCGAVLEGGGGERVVRLSKSIPAPPDLGMRRRTWSSRALSDKQVWPTATEEEGEGEDAENAEVEVEMEAKAAAETWTQRCQRQTWCKGRQGHRDTGTHDT